MRQYIYSPPNHIFLLHVSLGELTVGPQNPSVGCQRRCKVFNPFQLVSWISNQRSNFLTSHGPRFHSRFWKIAVPGCTIHYVWPAGLFTHFGVETEQEFEIPRPRNPWRPNGVFPTANLDINSDDSRHRPSAASAVVNMYTRACDTHAKVSISQLLGVAPLLGTWNYSVIWGSMAHSCAHCEFDSARRDHLFRLRHQSSQG